jgi:hypothetical protein
MGLLATQGGGVENIYKGHFSPPSKSTIYQKKKSDVSRVVDVDAVGCGCGFGFVFMAHL